MNQKKFFILTKTPLRVSFFGGGTDLPNFFNKKFGHVISSSINRYVYTSIKSHDNLFTESYRLNYSITEHVDGNINKIKNNLIRSCLKFLNIKENMHITISTDIPSMSGLGSSSSIIVGLLKALHVYKKKKISTKKLAEIACKIEIDIMKNPIGKQDQYSAVYGGFNSFKFYRGNKVFVQKLKKTIIKKIFQNLIFIWVGNFKESKKILKDQNKKISKRRKYYDDLLKLTALSKKMISRENFNLNKFGKLLDKNWVLKKKLSESISNNKIDYIYNKCLRNGSIGGKILGAGSGGFLLIVVNKNKKAKLMRLLKSYKIYSFSNTDKGVEVLYKIFY